MKRKEYFLLIYVICILLLVVLPINGKNSAINHTYVFKLRLDYLLHGLIFLPWMSYLFIKYKKPLPWLFIGIVFASMMEGLQYFLPYRAFNINDVAGNIAGVLAGAGVLVFNPKRFSHS